MNRNRMQRAFASIAALLASIALSASCDVFGSLASAGDGDSLPFVRFVEAVDGEIDLSLYATDQDREAWAIFTTGKSASGSPSAVSTSVAARAAVASSRSGQDPWRAKADAASDAMRASVRERLANFVPPVSPRLASSGGEPTDDFVGRTGTFVLYGDESGVDATCQLYIDAVAFGDAERSLSIWVQDSEWSGAAETDGMVSLSKVEALAKAFFGTAADRSSSIYAWVTNMLGDEWGAHSGSIVYGGALVPLISESGNITIFIADIDDDNSNNGGTVGYFYSGDTIPSFPFSNERVMFTIDSVMYGTGDGTWDSGDYWPETVFSTLAHEFQHMIHFYQKGVVAGGDYFKEPTWIDELCAMQVEDLLADKMGVPGPRGVAAADGTAGVSGNVDGRMPLYLVWPDLAPGDWDSASETNVLYYYSWAYSFGAYLTRNYGGAEFIRRVVQSQEADATAIASAAQAYSGGEETIETLLRRWGAAVYLSSRTDAPEYYRYNSGGFVTSTVGEVEYKLGSINAFNYLQEFDTNDDGTVDESYTEPYEYYESTIRDFAGDAFSNAFLGLGTPADRPSWKLIVPEGMLVTIVIN